MSAAALRARMEARIEALRSEALEACREASIQLQEVEVEAKPGDDLIEIDLETYDRMDSDWVLTAEAVSEIDDLLIRILEGIERQTAVHDGPDGHECRGRTLAGRRYREAVRHLAAARQAAWQARDVEAAIAKRFGS